MRVNRQITLQCSPNLFSKFVDCHQTALLCPSSSISIIYLLLNCFLGLYWKCCILSNLIQFAIIMNTLCTKQCVLVCKTSKIVDTSVYNH